MTNEKETALAKNPKAEWEEDKEADVIWVLDMMHELGVQQHNMANCSITAAGDVLFVNTSNGVDEAHINLPAPYAPTFIAVDKNTGKVLWTDNSPGPNVLHGQWSSPAYAVIDGQPQAILGCGDGWVYSFDPRASGKPKLLWKFDCNPKKSRYVLGSRATRNHIIATPVVYKGLVYIGVGEDPEHGEGDGHLWCIDPTKRGDVSPELVFNAKNPDVPIAPKRNQACVEADGDFTRENPNSAWCGTMPERTATATVNWISKRPCTARAAPWRSKTICCSSPISADWCIASTRKRASATGRTTCRRLAGRRH